MYKPARRIKDRTVTQPASSPGILLLNARGEKDATALNPVDVSRWTRSVRMSFPTMMMLLDRFYGSHRSRCVMRLHVESLSLAERFLLAGLREKRAAPAALINDAFACCRERYFSVGSFIEWGFLMFVVELLGTSHRVEIIWQHVNCRPLHVVCL